MLISAKNIVYILGIHRCAFFSMSIDLLYLQNTRRVGEPINLSSRLSFSHHLFERRNMVYLIQTNNRRKNNRIANRHLLFRANQYTPRPIIRSPLRTGAVRRSPGGSRSNRIQVPQIVRAGLQSKGRSVYLTWFTAQIVNVMSSFRFSSRIISKQQKSCSSYRAPALAYPANEKFSKAWNSDCFIVTIIAVCHCFFSAPSFFYLSFFLSIFFSQIFFFSPPFFSILPNWLTFEYCRVK